MKAVIFNTKKYDREFLTSANHKFGHELKFLEPHLNLETAKLAAGFPCVSAFVNDQLDAGVLKQLSGQGVQLIALRCAGFNQVDLEAAAKCGVRIARVPAYSPHGVAEHAVALMLALNRKIHKAHQRVHEGNFSLDGLLGFEFYGRTVGVLGAGKIGVNLARIMKGFGSHVIVYDPFPNDEITAMGAEYVSLDELIRKSDVISLHVPLLEDTYHVINDAAIEKMKKGVMIINTSRGGLVDAKAVIRGLKSGKIGYLGLDVYEEEADIFFEDLQEHVLLDDVFARLLSFPNVLVTGHQAFFTRNALTMIAETTLQNMQDFEAGSLLPQNEVVFKKK